VRHFHTGFEKLDKITSGWHSDLIIAARPAMGKTAFVLSMARIWLLIMECQLPCFH
jgi:replicative DNA helicase